MASTSSFVFRGSESLTLPASSCVNIEFRGLSSRVYVLCEPIIFFGHESNVTEKKFCQKFCWVIGRRGNNCSAHTIVGRVAAVTTFRVFRARCTFHCRRIPVSPTGDVQAASSCTRVMQLSSSTIFSPPSEKFRRRPIVSVVSRNPDYTTTGTRCR